MLSLRACVLLAAVGVVCAGWAEAGSPQTPSPSSAGLQPQEQQAAGSNYNPAMFLTRIPADQLAFLKQFDGASSKDLFKDKQFRKLMKSFKTDCEFHYGRDMPLSDALELVIEGSREPVRIREGRYLTLSGSKGPYLGGRGLLWIDLQEGIGLGAFYFHPTNGEPTPSVNVFSRQVRDEMLALSQLPPAFAEDLGRWAYDARVEEITTRYFLTGSKKKVLLEHDEDYCLRPDGTVLPPESGCEQRNADAADLDLDAAIYLDQTGHVTNATAWMITGTDQVAWLQVRTRTCGTGLDPLGCRIRLTRERTRVILRGPVPRPRR